MPVGVYPGSFNPPTVAHLAVAEAAVEQCRLDRLDLTLSVDPLGKQQADLLPVADRVDALRRAGERRPWLAVRTSQARLIADLADGYDVVVVGADKWAQVVDPRWYGDSVAARDEALARLPHVAVAPRAGAPLPSPPAGLMVTVLDVHPDHHEVSATGVRDGQHEWLAPEARHLLPPP